MTALELIHQLTELLLEHGSDVEVYVDAVDPNDQGGPGEAKVGDAVLLDGGHDTARIRLDAEPW